MGHGSALGSDGGEGTVSNLYLSAFWGSQRENACSPRLIPYRGNLKILSAGFWMIQTSLNSVWTINNFVKKYIKGRSVTCMFDVVSRSHILEARQRVRKCALKE